MKFVLFVAALVVRNFRRQMRQNEGGKTSLSKLTLAALEDIGYIVDPSQVSTGRNIRGHITRPSPLANRKPLFATQ